MRLAFLFFMTTTGFLSVSNAGFSKELVYAKVKSFQPEIVVIETPDNKKWQVSRKGLNKNVKLIAGNFYIFDIAPSSRTPLKR